MNEKIKLQMWKMSGKKMELNKNVRMRKNINSKQEREREKITGNVNPLLFHSYSMIHIMSDM